MLSTLSAVAPTFAKLSIDEMGPEVIRPGRPLMPDEALAVAWSESDPVRVVILEALIIPVVKASRVKRTDALIDVSVMVTASFPKPVIVPAALAA